MRSSACLALIARYTATTPVELSGVGFVPFAVDQAYEELGAWSPDGKSLAYVRHTADGGAQIVLRAEDSSAWTSRGGRLAYVASRGDGEEIWMRTAEDLSDRRVITAHTMPDPRYRIFTSLEFSPDGQWLAFVGAVLAPELKGRIWIAPAGGGTPRPVTPEGMLALRSSWAPDGRSLVVFLNDRGTHGLWIVGLDASLPPGRLLLAAGVDARLPEWSPTGEWISAVERPSTGADRPTLIIEPDTGMVRRLPSVGDTAVVWSRDGRTLYGVNTRDGTAKLNALFRHSVGSLRAGAWTVRMHAWSENRDRFLQSASVRAPVGTGAAHSARFDTYPEQILNHGQIQTHASRQ